MTTEERIALVEASQQVYQENIETAILCERERCAKIAESMQDPNEDEMENPWNACCRDVADKIRRGEINGL